MRGNRGPVQKEMGELAILDKEKVEVLRDFSASVFEGKCSSRSAQVQSK